MRGVCIFLFLVLFLSGVDATVCYRYRIYLTDKSAVDFAEKRWEPSLSPQSLDRKRKQGVAVDTTDYPVNADYLARIEALGVRTIVTSRWMNTAVVETTDTTVIERIAALPFVSSSVRVWFRDLGSVDLSRAVEYERTFSPGDPPDSTNVYGRAYDQLSLHNGDGLHQQGFRGKGVTVAVIDAGFQHVDRMTAFDHLAPITTYDFVRQTDSVYDTHYHGTRVLSAMAALDTGRMIGTAPDASYLLLRTEDSEGEFPIEEDYWAAAVEYADSIGADIATSSLGYSRFDEERVLYDKSQIDGQHAFITNVANIAARKGLLMIVSAGNENNSDWGAITFPADSPFVLTIGAIDKDGERSSFSSHTLTVDKRQKPDVVSIGGQTALLDVDGSVIESSGTSYSTPIIAGLMACLKQALPTLSNTELMDLVRQSASGGFSDGSIGCGIPDFTKALERGLILQQRRQ